MKQYIPCRIATLQGKLREHGLDAALIYDRENLIYFAGISDLEGRVLCVPSDRTAELFCLWMEVEHMRRKNGLKVTGYLFPADTQSTMAAKWLHKLGLERSRVGFTRYFTSLKDCQCFRETVPQTKVEDIATVCYQLHSIKCPEEIWHIRAVPKALKAGMDATLSVIRAGISERDMLVEAECAMGKAGSQGSPFRMQVLTYSRQMQKYPYAGAVLLEDNALVMIHLGVSVEGYTAKMCRTAFLDTPPEACVEIYRVLRRAQEIAVARLRPGMTCGALCQAATDCVKKVGYGEHWVMEYTGYGVDIRQSEFYPIIAKGSAVLIGKNMAVSLLLPSVYVPNIGGPRLTDTILVTTHGAEYLTGCSQEIWFRWTGPCIRL